MKNKTRFLKKSVDTIQYTGIIVYGGCVQFYWILSLITLKAAAGQGDVMEIGSKIRRLRLSKNLTQEELADRTELSKSFISQVERDRTSPSIATLVDILQALGTNLRDFFNDETDSQIVFKDSDFFEKTDEDLGSRTEWIIPNAQKNRMEPIRVTLRPGGRTYLDNPHEGEEFGYVLSGIITIHLGNQTCRARKGETFCFRPFAPHYIENKGKNPAVLIWVSTPPEF